MIAAWMLHALTVTLLLALAAWSVEAMLALYRLPRRGVWIVAALLAVALPLLALLPVAPEPPATSNPAAPVMISNPVAESASAAPRILPGSDLYSATLGATAFDAVLSRLLAAGWLIGSALMLTLFAHSLLRLTRRRGGWREQAVAGSRVLVTDAEGPAVIGLRRPVIIVPAWLLAVDEARQRLVVRHECEHVRRGDHLLLPAAAVVAALLPWNLPLHWMLGRLRLAVEIDCDRRVLDGGAGCRDYGGLLIDMAGRTQRLSLAVPMVRGGTDLERRIRAMTWKLPRFRPLRAVAGAACAATLFTLACLVDPVDPALHELPEATIGDGAVAPHEPAAAASGTPARFMINGRHVSAATFRDTLLHQGFTMVEVVDATASGSGAAEVRMRSHAAARAEGLAIRIARAGGVAPPLPTIEPGIIGPATPVRFVVDGQELPPGVIHAGSVPRDFVRFQLTADGVPEARMTSAAAYAQESAALRRARAGGS